MYMLDDILKLRRAYDFIVTSQVNLRDKSVMIILNSLVIYQINIILKSLNKFILLQF